jgi:Arc/MetJ family transcription regulator
MKTTIDIPDEMLKKAMEYSGAATKCEAVSTALTQYNRRFRLDKARSLLGTFKNLMTVEQLGEPRNKRGIRMME